mmetsp:Transcript_118715/g.340804  ORF Transcript_118715/g.340804 Transcript_118715/m.340804 type:complete len:290 (+) Transcript_118715:683-1552(+)
MHRHGEPREAWQRKLAFVVSAKHRDVRREIVDEMQPLLHVFSEALSVARVDPSILSELLEFFHLHREDQAQGQPILDIGVNLRIELLQDLEVAAGLGGDVLQSLVHVRKLLLQAREVVDDPFVRLHKGPQHLDLLPPLPEARAAPELVVEEVPPRHRRDEGLYIQILHQQGLEAVIAHGFRRVRGERGLHALRGAIAHGLHRAHHGAGGVLDDRLHSSARVRPEGRGRDVPPCEGARVLVLDQVDMLSVDLVVRVVLGVRGGVREAEQRATAQIAMLVHAVVVPGERIE